jgi:pyruvate-ferredoxin/flavodoxin oxidoreductase
VFVSKQQRAYKYPGIRLATDGNGAVILAEREASDAAGAYPITPSTPMGEYWAEEASRGHRNVSGRPLIFIEPEGEHAAAAITAGLAMTGLRAANFSSGQGVAYMHESLYAAVGKRLTYVLNVGCRAISKASLNVHAGHDDYHCVDDTGFFQLMAKNAQEAGDLNLIAHRTAELALTPGIVGQDGFLTTHLIESLRAPERELVAEYLGRPEDLIETPTPAQRLLYGEKRRRIPALWDVDNPLLSGPVQNQDAYMQAVAAQRPYFFAHIPALADRAMEELHGLTGRRYARVGTYRVEDAEYLIVGQGSVVGSAEAVADYLRESRRLRVGVVNMTMFRPFPGDLLGHLLKGRKGVAVLERTDQPLAEDLPLMREIRAVVSKCIENNVGRKEAVPYPGYAVYARPEDIPRLYSGAFGLGSRDLQPEGLIGAVENMLPEGAKRRFYYLSIDFVRDRALTPKQEIFQQEVAEAYPGVRELAVRGSENPDLSPAGSISVRMHSVGGWGAITTGKNLALTLFELLDYEIQANPKYGSEKKGQPTTYYLSAAPERIRVNCEYIYVDVVLSPDPNVFGHSNPLHGLKKGGVFVIQSDLQDPAAVWRSLPREAQRTIVDRDIRVFFLDAFAIAREEASDPELQFRMQGNAFQGAFFRVSPAMASRGLSEDALFQAIRGQLESKFGSKGARVVEDNIRVVRRGFDEVREVTERAVTESAPAGRRRSLMPVTLKRMPASADRLSDIHRFWEQTGFLYVGGKGSDSPADPFIAMSLMPASSGLFRDMTQIRFEHPAWVPEKCTACGDCYTVCPDSAIPGLVTPIGQWLDTGLRRVEARGHNVKHLRRALRLVERRLRASLGAVGQDAAVGPHLERALAETVLDFDGAERAELETELGWYREVADGFQLAVTRPYYALMEQQSPGTGGLFSITVNPYTCKGCMECVTVCADGALRAEKQTPESVARLRRDWELWLDLPTTPREYIRIDDLDERIGALETLLLDKRNYNAMLCGDGACLGCGEKTAVHLFTATVAALMQERVGRHVRRLDDLIGRLDQHIRLRLAGAVDLSDTAAIVGVADAHQDVDLTLSRLAASLEQGGETRPLDPEWLKWAAGLLAQLRDLRWRYTQGTTGDGRAHMGIINATGCTSVWGSTFPYNPYPFPWTSHLFQDSPSMAMGIFEGHMARMAEGFKAIRMAEIELDGGHNAKEHEDLFAHFGWRQFSDEEFRLCPPVVAVGGDGAMYDIGFQNLSRMMMSAMPVKVLVLDTQVYSNTGGQACTSGFLGQVSDMAPFGQQAKGKQELRKEMSLIGMAHRTTFVLQGSMSNVSHLIEGFIEGLNSRRPALFNLYAVCQPEHGVADDASEHQSRLAVESRAYPLLKYDPDRGETFAECCDLSGNPALDQDWPTYTLSYLEEDGREARLDLAMTFADFALTEGRFRKHFRKVPRDAWNDSMLPLAEFLDLPRAEREERVPYVWAVDKKNRLMRVMVSPEIAASAEERRTLWRMLKSLAGVGPAVDVEGIAERARTEMAQRIAASLLAMAGGGGAGVGALAVEPAPGGALAPGQTVSAAAGFEAAWVDSPQCTACDECIQINPKVFAYDERKRAYVANPKGGPFRDIVRAAEKCTARVIHPGTPWDPSEKDLEKLVKRAAKYQ